MKKLCILLADDHKIITEILRSILEPTYDVVGIVEDGQALVKEAIRLQPDVIVTDISMPKLGGIEAVRQIKKEGLQAKIIFLTMHADIDYASRAFEIGASGFLLKSSELTELLTAIKNVQAGKRYATSKIAELMGNDSIFT